VFSTVFHHGGTENTEVAQRTTQIRTLPDWKPGDNIQTQAHTQQLMGINYVIVPRMKVRLELAEGYVDVGTR